MTYSYARAYHRGIIKRLTPIEMPLFGPHLLRLSGECRRARFGNEVAFTVEPAWRRMGIGTALMQAAHSLARRRGLSEAFLIFHPHNVPMRRSAEKADADLRFEDDDCVATIPVQERLRIAAAA